MKKTFSHHRPFIFSTSLFFFLLCCLGNEAVNAQQCPATDIKQAIRNGNFEAGYVTDVNDPNYFYTAYNLFTPCSGCYSGPDFFYVGKTSRPFNPGAFDGVVDHTSGKGYFF